MKPNAMYIGSHGMGENICQIPAIRAASHKYNLCMAVPDNLVHLFSCLPWVNHVYPWSTFGIKAEGPKVTTNGQIFKFGYKLSLSAYYDEITGDESQLLPRHRVGTSMDYVTGMFYAVNGPEVFNDAKAEDFILRFIMPDKYAEPYPSSSPKLCLLQGSGELVRQVHIDNLNMIKSALMGKNLPFFCQHAGTKDMETLCRMLYHCDLVITPDTGPLHLALALGKQVILLESREVAEQVVGMYNRNQVYVIAKHNPECGQDCHTQDNHRDCGGKTFIREVGDTFVPPQHKEGYPFTLSCWGSHAPCLRYSSWECEEVAQLADQILSGGLARRASPCESQLGEVPLPH